MGRRGSVSAALILVERTMIKKMRESATKVD
nr:MAG TPA: hypothetical protein [Caudoviricetes sp.]